MSILTIITIIDQNYKAILKNGELILQGNVDGIESDCISIRDFISGAAVFADQVDLYAVPPDIPFWKDKCIDEVELMNIINDLGSHAGVIEG